MLAPGTYDLSVSLYDYSCSHAFDFRHRTLRFDVERGDPAEEHGVMALGGTWEGAVARCTRDEPCAETSVRPDGRSTSASSCRSTSTSGTR